MSIGLGLGDTFLVDLIEKKAGLDQPPPPPSELWLKQGSWKIYIFKRLDSPSSPVEIG